MNEQTCPICGKVLPSSPRYPRYVCADCVSRACNAQGLAVSYRNATVHGTGVIEEVNRDGEGIIARETSGYGPFDCWIDGIRCEAAEAYLGGVVIQTQPDPG